jgi:hypothetical protein
MKTVPIRYESNLAKVGYVILDDELFSDSVITELDGRVTTLEEEMDTAQSDITDLQTKIVTVNVTDGQDYTLVPNNVNDIVIVNNDSTTYFDVIGTINGQTNFTLYIDESLSLSWNGSEWRII